MISKKALSSTLLVLAVISTSCAKTKSKGSDSDTAAAPAAAPGTVIDNFGSKSAGVLGMWQGENSKSHAVCEVTVTSGPHNDIKTNQVSIGLSFLLSDLGIKDSAGINMYGEQADDLLKDKVSIDESYHPLPFFNFVEKAELTLAAGKLTSVRIIEKNRGSVPDSFDVTCINLKKR